MLDVLIIGAGVSGVSCAMVLGSAQNKPFANDKKIAIVAHQKASSLQNAIFNMGDCGSCVHNTELQSGLFGSDESALCSKASCFHQKTQEALEVKKAEAEASSNQVIADSEKQVRLQQTEAIALSIERIAKAGVDIPVAPGIMPITKLGVVWEKIITIKFIDKPCTSGVIAGRNRQNQTVHFDASLGTVAKF